MVEGVVDSGCGLDDDGSGNKMVGDAWHNRMLN